MRTESEKEINAEKSFSLLKEVQMNFKRYLEDFRNYFGK